MLSLLSADFFSRSTFSIFFFQVYSDQARYCVGPDLGPTCLQRLSADDTRRLRVNN